MTKQDTTRDKRKQYAERQRQARRQAGLVDMPGYFPASTAEQVRELAKRENMSIQRVIPVLVAASLSMLEQGETEHATIHDRFAQSRKQRQSGDRATL